MTATLAMESASSAQADKSDRLHRGRRTVGAFLMQGWGQFINQAVLIVLLLIFKYVQAGQDARIKLICRDYSSGASGPYSEGVGQATYRVSFAFIALFILWLLYYRIWRIKGADEHIQKAKKQGNVSGYDIKSLKLALRFYWHRLFATAVGWFCNDWFFVRSEHHASMRPKLTQNKIVWKQDIRADFYFHHRTFWKFDYARLSL